MPERINILKAELEKTGYIARHEECMAVLSMLEHNTGVCKSLLIEGPPGVGKTYLGESVAKMLDANFVYHLCHSWTDADELFTGINVKEAVAGNAEGVSQPGVLHQTAKFSHIAGKKTVLILDEIDKAPEKTEYLLLDWLQSGRVPIGPGMHLSTDLNKVLVFLTSNGVRSMSDALLRRVRRLSMEPLTESIQEDILVRRTGMPTGLVKVVWKAARMVAKHDNNPSLSLQEGFMLLNEIRLATKYSDLHCCFNGWAARADNGRNFIKQHGEKIFPSVWSEIVKLKRTQVNG